MRKILFLELNRFYIRREKKKYFEEIL